MNVPESGIYIFDNQGNFLQKVSIQIEQRMCFYKEQLFWIEGERLKMYSLATKAIFDLGKLPTSDIESIQIGQEIMTLRSEDKIKVYPIPEGMKRIK